MNLHFSFVAEAVIDGKPYNLERAVITDDISRLFWMKYKMLPPDKKRLLMVRKEEGVWVVYRYRNPYSIRGPETTVFPTPYVPKSLHHLLPYQPRSVASLVSSLICNNAALDGSDTGLGKTYVGLACCRELSLDPGIVCKKAGIAGWKRACAFFGIKPAFIVNWEYAKSGKLPYVYRTRDEYSGAYHYLWNVPRGVILIFDEVHMANHKGSQNYALHVASKGITSLNLSATPADRPSRLRGLFHVLGICDLDRFTEYLSERGCFSDPGQLDPEEESLSDEQDMAEFNKTLYPAYGYRLSYSDPDVKKFFPHVVHQVEVVSLDSVKRDRQNRLYQIALSKIEYYQKLGKQAEAMVADLRYRQESELLKADALAELASEYRYEGKSVIIFVNFRETLAYLSVKLDTKDLIYGGQTDDREKIIEAFQANGISLLLCMVDAGGTSLDLHDLHGGHARVSLVCPTYNPITLKQICGRTHRAGSKSTPIIKLVYAAGTVEEKVAERVNQKMRNINALNSGDLMEPDIFSIGVERE